MNGWRKIKTHHRDIACGRHSLILYIPENADPDFWQQTAVTYINDDIPALETIPSSRKAKVQAGRLSNSFHRHFFKLFYPRNRLEYIKQIFRKSRAFRDLKGTYTAASKGLKVPGINCVIEIRKWGIIVKSAIITQEVTGTMPLAKWLQTLDRPDGIPTRRHLMRQLGREMARWHRAGMRHGDARDSNILCRIPETMKNPDLLNPDPVEFCWLDNERSRIVIRKRDFIRNLVQLNMTRNGVTITDRMRFWEAYWADAGHVHYPRTRKSVLNEVIAKSRKRWKMSGML